MSDAVAIKKPLGIVIVAIYTAFSAVISIPSGFLMLLAGSFETIYAALGLFFLIFGVLAAAATYGLWTFQIWGYKLTKILYMISIPIGIIALFADLSAGNVLIQLFGVGIACWILFFLYKPETQSFFK